MAHSDDSRLERTAHPDPRSVPELLSDLVNQTTTLFRQEGELIRAELSEKVTQIVTAAGSLAAGAILLLVALNVLAFALVVALTHLVGPGWASLIVGVILAAIGALLLMKGRNDLNASNLAPRRTMHQMKRDADLVKEQV